MIALHTKVNRFNRTFEVLFDDGNVIVLAFEDVDVSPIPSPVPRWLRERIEAEATRTYRFLSLKLYIPEPMLPTPPSTCRALVLYRETDNGPTP